MRAAAHSLNQHTATDGHDGATRSTQQTLASSCRARLHFLLEPFLQPLQVEIRSFLHGRIVDEGLRVLPAPPSPTERAPPG
jgi:hypothetical protein